jgi:hypothetical protein
LIFKQKYIKIYVECTKIKKGDNMNKTEINKILKNHKKWLDGEGGERANLSEANLSEANLYGANLSEANLSRANLSEANLFRADLSEANLSRANLSEANLFRADLSEANLYGANLFRADLSEADLSRAKYSISQILYQVKWPHISDEITLELMRHDAEFVEKKAMNEWAKGGPCPYRRLNRDFIFSEKAELWKPGVIKPKWRGVDLFNRLAMEIKLKI